MCNQLFEAQDIPFRVFVSIGDIFQALIQEFYCPIFVKILKLIIALHRLYRLQLQVGHKSGLEGNEKDVIF